MAPESSETQSLLHIETISQYVALPPSTLATPHTSLCASLFSPLLLTYYPPVRGIVLSYSNVKLSFSPNSPSIPSTSKSKSNRATSPTSDDDEEDEEEESEELLLKVVDEYSAVFTWATASFLVLRPEKNVWISGLISSQSESHIQISYLNAFSVSILRKDLPSDWEWVSDYTTTETAEGQQKWKEDGAVGGSGNGYFVNGEGEAVEGVLRVRIRDFDLRAKSGVSKGVLRIEGSLLKEEEETSRLAGDSAERRQSKKKQKKQKGTLREEGPAEGDAMEIS
ncbi:hypothetical protein GQ43DRAFT_439953 [Delitschia confertaspora ATCC 74209]|uniref:DNA-directed RNA polymerase subunit n=1 Tax=Delitschia confertaspora ATCC 74209 TaxID=1513339 RepID=A0A9P4JPS5_9PLEO|nr:hypothetical protein GQ43DRAFT_439953 [Delitschia confertaspora ATCC 74209]